MVGKAFRAALLLAVATVSAVCFLRAPAEGKQDDGFGDTMLMFVGEDLEILSIASKREESAWEAPAVAHVVTKNQIEKRGLTTLGETLSLVPGFYTAGKEWGDMTYLRGIPNSVLFLHDTVPTGSDVIKTLNPLGRELSLNGVKRIEIVRGPGSVLWGADALAGIVNIVPMDGRDFQGVETGVSVLDGGKGEEFYLNAGHESGAWNGFVSVTGRRSREDEKVADLVRFWADESTPVPADERIGEATPDRSEYLEVDSKIAAGDAISISTHISQYTKPYAVTGPDGVFTWLESRDVSTGYIKMEGNRNWGPSTAVRLLLSQSWMNPDWEIIDITLSQEESTSYGELSLDRSFESINGVLTTGISYREKHVSDAPVWDKYLYDYFSEDNEFFAPSPSLVDYETRLWSGILQYRQKIRNIDFLIGVREDSHAAYEDKLSYNVGAVWSPSPRWAFKLLHGTAYRTPFAKQLWVNETPKLEQIVNWSVQASWKPDTHFTSSVSLFTNRIDNHVMEDSYAGLSVPNHQDIFGAEAEITYSPIDALILGANLTLLDNSGPKETYKYNDYDFFRPDGTIEKHYVDLFYPFDAGPERIFNATAQWRLADRLTFFSRLSFVSERKVIHPLGTSFQKLPAVSLLDLSATYDKFFFPKMTFQISIKNLLDEAYKNPGTYSAEPGTSRSIRATLNMRF